MNNMINQNNYKKKLFLIDISSLIFRAFYAIRPLTSPTGLPTNATYGVFSMILKLMNEEKPQYMVFCYDRKEPSFRKDIFPEYKAHRTEMPETLVPQIEHIKRLPSLLGIPSIEVPSYEADDLIGTLAKAASKQGFEVDIVSGDKDFGQLIQPGIFLYDTMKSVRLDSQGVKEKWGVPPEQFIDYLALVGDPSDNIPGVDGIGSKGAQKLLLDYSSLSDIYKAILEDENAINLGDKARMSDSLRKKLIAGKENAFLSQKLVTIATNVPLDTNIETYHLKSPLWEELKSFLEEMNFRNLDRMIDLALVKNHQQNEIVTGFLKDFEQEKLSTQEKSSDSQNQNHEKSIMILNDVSLLEKVLIREGIYWGLLTTAGISIVREKISEKILPDSNQSNEFFKANESDKDTDKDEDEVNDHQKMIEGFLLPIAIENEWFKIGKITDLLRIQWCGFDLKSFWHLIQSDDPVIKWDSMLASYLLKAGDSTSWSRIYSQWMHENTEEKPNEPFDFYLKNKRLERILKQKINETKSSEILKTLDFPLTPLLYHMERVGIKINKPFLQKFSEELTIELDEIKKQIYILAEEEFNISSPKQLSHILFEKLMLPSVKKTKTGYSTDSEVLEKLKLRSPIIQYILDYREIAKLKSSYVDTIPALANTGDRVHTTFRQALTTTGRLSSVEPNLQNIPIRTERGALIRKSFIAEENYLLFSADYSQIELRILAHFSEDPNLIKAFQQNEDIHTRTASEIFGVSQNEVNADMRRTAKAVNFGIAYGQSAYGLSEVLGISRPRANDIITKYFEKFSRVKEYIEDTIIFARNKGFVETLFGRRRYIDDINSKNKTLRQYAERSAINAPMQGTASDIVKKAMIAVHKKTPLKLLLQVHDELIFEGTKEEINQWSSFIINSMENITSLKVPLRVHFSYGKNWDEAH